MYTATLLQLACFAIIIRRLKDPSPQRAVELRETLARMARLLALKHDPFVWDFIKRYDFRLSLILRRGWIPHYKEKRPIVPRR